ncbi:MAG: response regulator transcription factor [Epsilonproteobacteria bacterium]|nr:response regulator transcription factor [Campylobacterota bacterium]
MKILLLEDELMLQSSIQEYLESLGHSVLGFTHGDKAKEAILNESFDLLILDINVPNLDGFELLSVIHDNNIFTPAIYISALVDIDDIEQAFDLGAYDYLKKPFHLKELGLRINNVANQMINSQRQHIVLSPNYSFSKDTHQLCYLGEPQTLTRKQILILDILCQHIGVLVSFDNFRSFVWNHEPVDNATIRAEISRLRRTLKEDFIQNVKGVGYKVERYIKI